MDAVGANARALLEVRDHLEQCRYALVDLRLSMEVPPGPTGFPAFDAIRALVERLDPGHRLLFRLLRLGEPVADAELRLVGDPLVSALRRAGLLVPADAPATWRTPSLLLVPAEGLLLLASVPGFYPTASGPRDTWFDLSATVVARALPGSLEGARVLDVCSGTGIQALLCARRGASRIVGLDVSERAVAIANANAILNGHAGAVDFRRSDMLAALEPGERFDYVVCNTPYAPTLVDGRPPSAPADLGNSVVWRLLDALPEHLTESAHGVIGLWRSIGHRGSTYQLRQLARRLAGHGYDVSAYVDAAPESREGVLRLLRSEWASQADADAVEERVRSVEQLLDGVDPPIDGFYNQLVFVESRERAGAPAQASLFGIGIRDGAQLPLP